ncbi:YhgE/Pip domain-containing protein [Paramicrobacterium chengjingii]|uniref:YhgE/Pip domain-containing protein n=1 Tax=Paramicrobacterium chengjingii TaxID=2769067 RepID=A0ABX6YFZ3_9MICO|nr:YhgE/Pip domain-containing protein [Microbacterium chengjingii]QPZ37717.1 YhgE/Pip domain-containing protein [Microbacterium chengjingii]
MSNRFSFIERTDSTKRVRPLTLVGLLLVPFVIAGMLVWALWDPSDRLDSVKAAIVNNDEPVEVNGQTVPLGRQLGAGLVGSDDEETNYTWEVTDSDGASEGLKDGTYAAVVTIPENFSEAATSTAGDADDAEQAVIDVTTSENSRLIDDAVSQVVTTTAANVLGTNLTTNYLDNVFLGFNTLHDQLGDAADGATELADGTTELSDGMTKAADGAGELAESSDDLVTGAQGLADGASGIADGAGELTTGAQGIADGASKSAAGASALSGGASQLGAGLQGLVDGLNALKTQTAALPGQAQGLADGAAGVSTGVNGITTTLEDSIQPLVDACSAGDPEKCVQLKETVAGVTETSKKVGEGASGVSDGMTKFSAGMQPLADGIASAADGAAATQTGANDLATGASGLADGLSQLSGGASQLAGGAGQLGSGAEQLSTGASQYATGIEKYTGGVVSLSEAMTKLGDGTSELSDGAGSLADGLDQAVEQIPNYSESERSSLSEVVADPVSASDDESAAFSFGSGGIPLYAVIALWLGALATFFLLRATPRAALGSTRSAFMLTLRSALPGLVLGVVQGVLVSIIVSIAQGMNFAEGLGFAGIAALIGASFSAVNQALVAVLGGAGRFISMIVGILALATGVISTVPGVLDQVFGMLPVSPARDALSAVIIGTPGIGAAIVALAVWLIGAVAATTLSVALRRTVSSRKLTAIPA